MEIARIIYCQAFELAAYNTGRLVTTALCGSRVRVQAPFSGMSESFSWHGFRRDADGTLVMSEEMAELTGVVTWVAVMVTSVLTIGRL